MDKPAPGKIGAYIFHEYPEGEPDINELVELRAACNERGMEQHNKIAIVVADGFEQVELTEPRKALEQAGFKTEIVSPAHGKVKGWDMKNWGEELPVDTSINQARPGEYAALLLPGGVMNPDKLRRNEQVLNFVRSFFESRKPVAAICHGPWTLIDAGVVKGRKLTSYESIQTDLKNAGADWVDQEVVVDKGLITSRKPGDIPAFNQKMIEEFRKRTEQYVESKERETVVA